MRNGHDAMRKSPAWMWIILLLVVLVFTSTMPGRTWYAGRVFIEPRIVVPFGLYWTPYWAPYWAPYGYPPVVAAPPPQVFVQPLPSQPSWYYCENPQGYYPYGRQCPGGWRQVPPWLP